MALVRFWLVGCAVGDDSDAGDLGRQKSPRGDVATVAVSAVGGVRWISQSDDCDFELML